MELTVITEGARLSKSCVYQIENSLYRFLYSDPYARIDHPQYVFRPLGGQRRKADKVLNKRQLTLMVYEVNGMRPGDLMIMSGYVQMTLNFNDLEAFNEKRLPLAERCLTH